MNSFKMIKPEELTVNPFQILGRDWMLITAGDINSYNTMTAAWGSFGVLWHKNVCSIYIRPQRYTYEFIEKSDKFTLSFFPEDRKDVVNYCGKFSGRDVDKVKETDITPVELDSGAVSFKESKLIIECKKIYFQDLNPGNFLVPEIDKNYSNRDYHRMYIGEILSCYEK